MIGTHPIIESRQDQINILYSRLSDKKKDKPKGDNAGESCNMTDDQILGNALPTTLDRR